MAEPTKTPSGTESDPRATPPHPSADDTTAVLREQAQAAVRHSDFEAATRCALELARVLVERGQTALAIAELQVAVRGLQKYAGGTPLGHRLLWPVLATLARRVDETGDRTWARELATQAEDEAIRSRSADARKATRALLLYLAQRRPRDTVGADPVHRRNARLNADRSA